MAVDTPRGDPLEGASREDREIVRLARGASFSVVCSLIAQAALVATSIVLTQFLARSDVGLYAQAHAISAIGSLIGLVGMRSALTRFVAMYRVDSNLAAVHGTIRLGISTAALVGAGLGVVVFVSAEWLAISVFDDAALLTPIRWAAAILPGSTLLVAATSATQGYRNVRPFNVVRRLIEPGVKLGAILVVLSVGGSINAAMAASAATTWLAALIALVWLRKIAGPAPARISYNSGPILRFAFVSWGAAFAAQGLLWADILMVGWLLPSEDVALYQIASRVALLAALSIAPINAVLAPRVANLFRNNKTSEASSVYQVAAAWTLRLTLPAAVAIIVVPTSILSVFGSEYIAAVTALWLLVPGQLFNASTGTTATILNMAGENVSTLIGNTGSLAINLGLNAALIPVMGIEGAAVAWSASLIIVNLYRAVMVRRRVVAVWPWSEATTSAGVAAVISGVAGYGLHQLVLDGSARVWTLLPIGLIIVVVYIAVLAVWGLTDADRLLLAKFNPR